jgi:hypothetical protein
MKSRRFLLLILIPLVLAACQTVNRQDRAVLRAHNVPEDVYAKMVNGEPLSPDDVITLSQRRVPPGLIIHYIDGTDTAYRLRKADVERLRTAGVSDEVISYMLSTSAPYERAPYQVGSAPPYPYPYPYYPYDYYGAPYAGPVVVVGGGFHRWHSW